MLIPLLLPLYKFCWKRAYIPIHRRIAQVIPKKDPSNDSGNDRLIGLTSIFCNALVHCLKLPLRNSAPALGIAQDGLRENRGALDQVPCLAGTCDILKTRKDVILTLAFLEIKAAYDTVNRNIIWSAVQYPASPPLLTLFENLFDDVYIEVLLSHVVSYQFSPRTDVL